jgi:hypothetical protein
MVGSTIDLGADLADFNFDPALHADGQHQLKVIAQGNRLWFFVDGNYLWTLQKSGPTGGTAGFWGYNAFNSVYQTLQFSYLTVKALAP